jgi:K+-transporting ATPase ATPase C chain
MRRQLLTGLLMTVCLTVLLGLVYPLAVTGAGQALFHGKASGYFVKDKNGQVVGSSLIGQSFNNADGSADPKYFQPRPSAAGAGYDGTASGASNLGPSNPALLSAVADRVAAYRQLNGLDPSALVPVDAVTASASGLDPDISVANALLQAPRVAKQRNLSTAAVLALVSKHTAGRSLGFLGEKAVNVLELNLDLDRLG